MNPDFPWSRHLVRTHGLISIIRFSCLLLLGESSNENQKRRCAEMTKLNETVIKFDAFDKTMSVGSPSII